MLRIAKIIVSFGELINKKHDQDNYMKFEKTNNPNFMTYNIVAAPISYRDVEKAEIEAFLISTIKPIIKETYQEITLENIEMKIHKILWPKKSRVPSRIQLKYSISPPKKMKCFFP